MYPKREKRSVKEKKVTTPTTYTVLLLFSKTLRRNLCKLYFTSKISIYLPSFPLLSTHRNKLSLPYEPHLI